MRIQYTPTPQAGHVDEYLSSSLMHYMWLQVKAEEMGQVSVL